MNRIEEVNRCGFDGMDTLLLKALADRTTAFKSAYDTPTRPWLSQSNTLIRMVTKALRESHLDKLHGIVVPTALCIIIEYADTDLTNLYNQLVDIRNTYDPNNYEMEFLNLLVMAINDTPFIKKENESIVPTAEYSSVRVVEALGNTNVYCARDIIPEDLYFSLPYIEQTTVTQLFRRPFTLGVITDVPYVLKYKTDIVNIVQFLILVNMVNGYKRNVVREVGKAYSLLGDVFTTNLSEKQVYDVFRKYTEKDDRIFQALFGNIPDVQTLRYYTDNNRRCMKYCEYLDSIVERI